MRKLFILLNHNLNEKQIAEAHTVWQVDKIMETPQNIREFWSNIDPEMEFTEQTMEPVLTWLRSHAEKDDLVLIQGDFGAVFYTVDFCFYHGLVPIYATTKRTSKEEVLPDGTVKKTSVFNHIRFRKYSRYGD